MRWVLRRLLLLPVVALSLGAAPPSEPPGQAKRTTTTTTPTTTTTTATNATATPTRSGGRAPAAAAPASQASPSPAEREKQGTTPSKASKQAASAGAVRAAAVPALTIETITWDVIGLDSNDVTTGPNVFPVGVRVCATGGAVSGVTVAFTWDTANPYVQLLTAPTQSIASLADGACADRYFFVSVTRDPAAYDTTRGYHVTASASGVPPVSTPTPRQLYVERLLSQNRNAVLSITGPTTVYEGDTVTYTVEASTAPNGYSQLDTFLTMLSPIFEMLGIEIDYETPAGTTTSSPYADACGWDPNPSSGTYRSCVGPERIPGGKVGGLITGSYTGLVTGTGTTALSTAIIDVSGSSYHYNTDFGTAPNLLTVVALPSADLAIDKAAVGPFVAGGTGTYTLNVANHGPSTSPTPVTVTDTLPEGMALLSADGPGWDCSTAGRTVTCTNDTPLAAGATSTITLRVSVGQGLIGRIFNAATVSGPARDLDPADNTDSVAVEVDAPRPGETPRGSRGGPGAPSGPGTGGATGDRGAAADEAAAGAAGDLPATGAGSALPLTALAVVLLALGVALRRAAGSRTA